MSLSGLILGLINIALVVVILLLVGAIIVMGVRWLFNQEIDAMVQKLYLAAVGLVALYMIVALVFGIPSVRIIGATATFLT
jgi:hypothetical protein